MPRPAKGTIIERRNAAGGINRTHRFSVNGRKRAVGLGRVTEPKPRNACAMSSLTWSAGSKAAGARGAAAD
jgi:hypothetical protein